MSAAPRVGGATNQCILNFTAPSQAGTAALGAGAATIVPCPGLTATGLVVASAATAFVADQARPPVITAGVNQFTITLSAASAGTVFNWFVVKAA